MTQPVQRKSNKVIYNIIFSNNQLYFILYFNYNKVDQQQKTNIDF